MTKQQAEKRLAEIKPKEAEAWRINELADEAHSKARLAWQPLHAEVAELETFLKVVDK